MINYEITDHGKFTEEDFNEKIKKALVRISEDLKIDEIISKKVRHSQNIDYGKFSNNGMSHERFFGTYITIEISNKNKVLGYLNCFFDVEKGFIELSSSKSK